MFELFDFKMNKPVSISCEYLSFQVPGVVSVEGESGVGKSSFFRALVGLESCKFSKLNIGGKVHRMNFEEIRGQFLYLPQDPLAEDKLVLEYFIELSKYNPTFQSMHFDLLDILGLELLDKRISSLSGGENQIVKLEIMLGLNPKVVVLDEIFNGIDKVKIEMIKEHIARWIEGKLVFNIHHAETIFDRESTGKLIFSKSKDGTKVTGQ